MKSSPQNPKTLLDALSEQNPGSSRTNLKSWIKEGRISVDGLIHKDPRDVIDASQKIIILPKPKFLEGDLKILYKDKFLIILNKPEGLLTVKTNFEKKDNIYSYLKESLGSTVKVVHRLDQGTSGVIMFALNEDVYSRLKKMFEKHDLKRQYTAILEGHLTPQKGEWESYLYEDEAYVVHASSDPAQGKRALTRYEVKKKSKHYSLVELTLETGRKNQIRVQAQEAGHSVAGDVKYGAASNPIRRLALHAHLLEFTHPITKKTMRFEAPVPESFLRLFT